MRSAFSSAYVIIISLKPVEVNKNVTEKSSSPEISMPEEYSKLVLPSHSSG